MTTQATALSPAQETFDIYFQQAHRLQRALLQKQYREAVDLAEQLLYLSSSVYIEALTLARVDLALAERAERLPRAMRHLQGAAASPTSSSASAQGIVNTANTANTARTASARSAGSATRRASGETRGRD